MNDLFRILSLWVKDTVQKRTPRNRCVLGVCTSGFRRPQSAKDNQHSHQDGKSFTRANARLNDARNRDASCPLPVPEAETSPEQGESRPESRTFLYAVGMCR